MLSNIHGYLFSEAAIKNNPDFLRLPEAQIFIANLPLRSAVSGNFYRQRPSRKTSHERHGDIEFQMGYQVGRNG